MAKKPRPKADIESQDSDQDTNEALQIFEAVAEKNPDLLKGIEPTKQRELKKAFSIGISMVQQTHHSGPLPSPKTLEAYANIIPNGAERIMAMAEKEQEFRHNFDSNESRREKNIESRGQIFGFIICILVLSGGILLSYSGKQTTGLCAIIGALVALVGSFYYTQKIKSKTDL